MAETNETFSKGLSNISDVLYQPTVTYEESQELYKKWIDEGTYDKMLSDNPKSYGGVIKIKEASDKYFMDRENQLILDVGAGTGLIAQMLKDNGFKKLHGLEPLQEFVDEAKKKDIYSHFLIEPIGFGKQTSAKDDTYDGIVSSGSFGPGHIPCDAINEMIRIVKPGGHIIISMRHEYLGTVEEYRGRLVPLMKTLEERGKWKRIEREIYPRHFIHFDGILFVFQVC